MSAIHRITPDSQPVFPCWLWHPCWETPWERHEKDPCYPIWSIHIATHWHPDQPAAPAVTPGITTERDVRNTVTPAPAQGETPRTDAEPKYTREFTDSDYVKSDFARTLERELAEAKAHLVAVQKEWGKQAVFAGKMIEEVATLRQQLAAVRQWSEQAREAMQALKDSDWGDDPDPIIAKMDALLATDPAIDSAMKQEGRG